MTKKWQVQPGAPETFLKQFPEFSSLIVQLLYNRGLKTQREIDEFFNPDFIGDLFDPLLLKDMDKAVKRISRAIKRNEQITIYGDYDADGVCSSAIVYHALKELGHDRVKAYIPEREKEGHGLNEHSIKEIAQDGTKLIITVDCGVRDIKQVKLAKKLKLDVIITDHHEPGEDLPSAVAVIDHKRKDDKYPFKMLAGGGIAYKLACALLDKLEPDSPIKKWLLDLTAVATVADMMDIIGENRTIVSYGLGVLAQTKWLGLRELMKAARISPEITAPSSNGEAPRTNLSTQSIGFILGPRLNAAGRMNHADSAFYLLTTKDESKAGEIIKELDQMNSARQAKTDKIIQEVKNRLGDSQPKIVFEGSDEWPIGILGLAAGKLIDKFNCPTVIYLEKDDMVFASCRSIEQFNIIKAIEKAAAYLDDFGGHKQSAGFRLKKEHFDKVKQIITLEAQKKVNEKDLVAFLDIDAELCLDDLNWSVYDQIERFSPFGRGNPEPRFLISGVEVSELKLVGNGNKHLKMELCVFDSSGQSAKTFKAIGFGLYDWYDKLKQGDLIDVVFELIVDEWNGNRNLQMKIIDLKSSKL